MLVMRGVGAGFWTARCSASKFDDAASARDRDLMMRTAGARIMSISGARRAHSSPGLPADAHDAGFWGDYCPVHELALPAPGAALKYTSALNVHLSIYYVFMFVLAYAGVHMYLCMYMRMYMKMWICLCMYILMVSPRSQFMRWSVQGTGF